MWPQRSYARAAPIESHQARAGPAYPTPHCHTLTPTHHTKHTRPPAHISHFSPRALGPSQAHAPRMADITAEANNFREFFTAIDADGDGWINQTTDLSTVSGGAACADGRQTPHLSRRVCAARLPRYPSAAKAALWHGPPWWHGWWARSETAASPFVPPRAPTPCHPSSLLTHRPLPAQLLAKVGAPEPPARAHLASCVSNPHYINFDEFCGLLSKCSSGPSEAEIVQEMFTVRARRRRAAAHRAMRRRRNRVEGQAVGKRGWRDAAVVY